MRVYAPLHMLQNFFPGIHERKTLKKAKNSPRQLFPQLWKNCG
jgi:hypothetical protein